MGSCSDPGDPEIEVLEDYTFSTRGEKQRALSGSLLGDSVGLYISGLHTSGGENPTRLQVYFEVKSGGGTVDPQEVTSNHRSMALTRWQTGVSSTLQELEAQVYRENGEFLKSIPIQSYALQQGRWDTLYGGQDLQMTDMATDPDGDTTFFTTHSGLFAGGKQYFQWLQNTMPEAYNARGIECDPQGHFYMTNIRGELFKSTNSGADWQEVTEPAPGYENLMDLHITSNGYIWITPWYGELGLRCSRDGGQTWSIDTTGLHSDDRIKGIYRLPDGRFLLHTWNKAIYQSSDDGHTWEPFPSPDNPYHLFVTEQGDVIVFRPESRSGEWGYSAYRSHGSEGEPFTHIHHFPARGISTGVKIYSYNGVYYLGIPYSGVYTTAGFENFDQFAHIPDLFELYMSGRGVLIGTPFQRQKIYYYSLN